MNGGCVMAKARAAKTFQDEDNNEVTQIQVIYHIIIPLQPQASESQQPISNLLQLTKRTRSLQWTLFLRRLQQGIGKLLITITTDRINNFRSSQHLPSQRNAPSPLFLKYTSAQLEEQTIHNAAETVECQTTAMCSAIKYHPSHIIPNS